MASFDLLAPFSTGYTVKRPAINKSTQNRDEHEGSPLIRLLSIAMALEVNILPLKWRPGLEGLGRGATGQVNQSPLNADISLAFKRFVDFSDNNADLPQEKLNLSEYSAMSSEIVMLSHPEIYDHPNVVNLEGVCWEVVKYSNEIRPVLVFRKAEGGSLDTFLTTDRAQHLAFEDRVGICGEIAKALRILHLSGVVHGDLKAENILVFGSPDSDVYGVKVTDFGYSRFGDDEDLIELPESRPWQAPEYSDRHVPIQLAKRMDVYSFGLLVLWMLFMEENLNLENGFNSTLNSAFSGWDEDAQELLERRKQDGSLLTLSLQLVSKKTELSADLHQSLTAVFETSLERNPDKRAGDMQTFVQLLCMDESMEDLDRAYPNHIVQLPEWHGKMDVARCFFDLDACDFRVQSYIAKSLMSMADGRDCDVCSQNAAFQLAVCYMLGFGVDNRIEDCNSWLHRSKRSRQDLQELISRIKYMDPDVETMSQIITLGYQSNKGSDYYEDGILEEALHRYRRMAQDRENAFGRSHFATRRMYAQFSDLLAFDRQFEEAADILAQEMKISGSQSDELLVIQSKLARIYTRLSRLNEAEVLFDQILSSCAKKKSGDSALRINATCNWSNLILQRGDQKRAIGMALSALEESRLYLGPFHETTWRIKGVLVDAYAADGDLNAAINIIHEIIKEHRQAFGEDHHDTIIWMNRLGPLYVRLNDWEKAKNCFRDDFESLCKSQTTPDNHLQRLIAHSNYMGALARTGDAEAAIPKLQEIISELATLLPPDHLHILGSKNNLSIAFESLQMYEDAETLQREVLQNFQQCLAPGDAWILRVLANLSDTLFKLENWKDVAKYSIEEINIRQSQSMEKDEDLLQALQKLSRSKIYLECWEDAVDVLRQELELRETLSVLNSVDGLETIALLAVANFQIEKLEEGSVAIGEFFERFLEVNKARKSLLDIVYGLVDLCEQHGRYLEAEELLKLAVLLRQKLFPAQPGFIEDEVDRAKIFDLIQKQGKEVGEIRFDPTACIERAKLAHSRR